MRVYAAIALMNSPSGKSRLVQTKVSPTILRKLDALAKATGHSRASYLRHLIELHVKALDPKLAAALQLPKDKP